MISRFPPLAGSSCLTRHWRLSKLSHLSSLRHLTRLRLSVRFSRNATMGHQRRGCRASQSSRRGHSSCIPTRGHLYECPLASPSLPVVQVELAVRNYQNHRTGIMLNRQETPFSQLATTISSIYISKVQAYTTDQGPFTPHVNTCHTRGGHS